MNSHVSSFINVFICIDVEKSENEDKIEKICQHDKIVNDNICDDEANVYECDFDGGDCCAEESIKDFCLQCQCFCNTSS